MTIDSLILLAGGLIAVLPFLGIPNRIDTVLFALLGIFVISLGIVVRRRKEKKPRRRSVREVTTLQQVPEPVSVGALLSSEELEREHDIHEVR